MKELNAFELFGKISDDYVTEAVIPSAQILPISKRRFSETAFGRFINGPWGVAMLCAVVSIGVLVGIIAAGNAGDPGKTPVGNTVVSGISGDPESETPPDGATATSESTTVAEGTDSMQEATMPEETAMPEETTTAETSAVTMESTEIETPAESAATEGTTAFEEITLPEVSTEPKETVKLPEAVALPEHPTIEQSQYGEEAVILYDEEIFAKDLLYVDANGRADL